MVNLEEVFERISVEKIELEDLKTILGDDWSDEIIAGVGIWDEEDNKWLTVFAIFRDGKVREFGWD